MAEVRERGLLTPPLDVGQVQRKWPKQGARSGDLPPEAGQGQREWLKQGEWVDDPIPEVGRKWLKQGEEWSGNPSLEVGQGQGKVAESGGEVREPSLEVGQRQARAGEGYGRLDGKDSMGVMLVLVIVGHGEPRAEELRESGVRSGGCFPERSAADWLQKVLVRPLLDGEREGRESNMSDKVHLVEGLPPLPRKTVKRIQRGEFVEFTEFPIFDGGRKEGSWLKSKPEKTEGSPERQAGESRRRGGPREVPDAS